MYGVCTEQALSKRAPLSGPHHLCHQDCHPYCDQELRLHQAQERAPSDLEKLPPLRAREHVLGLARHPSPSLRAGWQRPRPRPHFQTQLCSGVPRSTSHLTGPHHLHFFLQSPFNPQRTASGTSLIFSGAETPGFIFKACEGTEDDEPRDRSGPVKPVRPHRMRGSAPAVCWLCQQRPAHRSGRA